jgi:hypothetical protein
MTDAELALMLQREEQQAHLLELAGYGDGDLGLQPFVVTQPHVCAPSVAAALIGGPAHRSR